MIPGFNDVLQSHTRSSPTTAFTVNYTINPTTFVEGTYGFIQNELAGGNAGGVLINESANRLDPAYGLQNFPLLYPNAGDVDPRVLRATRC